MQSFPFRVTFLFYLCLQIDAALEMHYSASASNAFVRWKKDISLFSEPVNRLEPPF